MLVSSWCLSCKVNFAISQFTMRMEEYRKTIWESKYPAPFFSFISPLLTPSVQLKCTTNSSISVKVSCCYFYLACLSSCLHVHETSCDVTFTVSAPPKSELEWSQFTWLNVAIRINQYSLNQILASTFSEQSSGFWWRNLSNWFSVKLTSGIKSSLLETFGSCLRIYAFSVAIFFSVNESSRPLFFVWRLLWIHCEPRYCSSKCGTTMLDSLVFKMTITWEGDFYVDPPPLFINSFLIFLFHSDSQLKLSMFILSSCMICSFKRKLIISFESISALF